MMSPELIATVLTGAAVLLGVWRLVEGVRRDLTAQIVAVNERLTIEVGAVNDRINSVNTRIDGINTRIDNILLADRKAT